MYINIAIDGPAGAGKSTIAKQLAKTLGYIYVDTGAMYRTLAVYFIRNKVGEKDSARMSALVDNADVKIRYENGEQQLYLNGENVTPLLRTEEVGNMASACAVNPDVRRKLTEMQKAMGTSCNLVMDGRDIGTTVLPDAAVKIFLTASVEVRAKRRYDELTAKGITPDLAQIQADIADRDYQDSHRKHSPLKQAADAVLVDTSFMTIEEVLAHILGIVREKVQNA